MKRRILFALAAITALGTLSAAQPTAAGTTVTENRSGVGIGLELGDIEADVFVTDIEFTGFSLFYKQRVTDRWSLLATYRDLEDDETIPSGEGYAYSQLAVHGVYAWRAGKKVRPHAKFGLARTDFEFEIPGLFSGSDDGIDMSIGFGLEAGSGKVAFFGDVDYSEPSIDFPDASSDLEILNMTIGVLFRR